MKNKYKNNISLYAGVVAICISFFLGYIFAIEKYKLEEKDYIETPQYVDVKVNTKNIEILNAPNNILFRVNGEPFHSGSISLK